MYKAGDFTNGKMNNIFKDATNFMDEKRYDKKSYKVGTVINHKQFGEFYLVSERTIAIKAAILYCDIAGVSIEDFYNGCDMDTADGNEAQLAKINDFIFPSGYDSNLSWFDSFMMLIAKVGFMVDNSSRNPCDGYTEGLKSAK